MIKQGWKVVRQDMTSAVIPVKLGGVKYVAGLKTHPARKAGPLTVFTTEEAAEYFISKMDLPAGVLKAYKCSYSECHPEENEVWTTGRYCHVNFSYLVSMNQETLLDLKSVSLANWIMIERGKSD